MKLSELPALDFHARIRAFYDNNINLFLEATARGSTICFDRQGFHYDCPNEISTFNGTGLEHLSSPQFLDRLKQLHDDNKELFQEMWNRKWWLLYDTKGFQVAMPTADSDLSPIGASQ